MGNNSNDSHLPPHDISLSYALWRHQVVMSMTYTCCVEMATKMTSCPCRQNQATFGSFGTLPIAGDFKYIF